MTFDPSAQTLLVTSAKKGQQLVYQVEKDGIVRLRALRNKKFRVLFNIFPLQNHQPSLSATFSRFLFNATPQQQQPKPVRSKHQQNHMHQKHSQQSNSFLTISQQTKQLSENRLIITLNAYMAPEDSPNLVILGYLISSLVVYHNWDSEFSEESGLTRLLALTGKLLKKTQIDKLNEDIKFKTGYDKQPYLLCLVGLVANGDDDMSEGQISQEMAHKEHSKNYLHDFYRFESQKTHSQINSALQTLIDYFPQRSSLEISLQKSQKNLTLSNLGQSQVSSVGGQFEQKLIGRQLFSFEFTSTTVENLIFEMCECFNAKKEINLVEVYGKVIANKKARVETEMLEMYLGLVGKGLFMGCKVDLEAGFEQNWMGNSVLPMSECQLNRVLREFKDIIFKEAQAQALNCMNLEEYLETNDKILKFISTYEQKLRQLNTQLGSKFVSECLSVLEVDPQQLTIDWKEVESASFVSELFTFLANKLSSFSHECISLFAEGDSSAVRYVEGYGELAGSYMSIVQGLFVSAVQQLNLTKRTSQLEIQTLKFELKKSLAQKQTIEQAYQLQLLMQAELKAKVQEHILEESSFSSESTTLKKHESLTLSKKIESSNFNSSKEYYRMKKTIEELEEEVKDKNNHIQELTEILQKFQSTVKATNSLTFIDKKNDKFTDETQKLIAEASSKILNFYQILQEVKNVQKHYENAKKSLLKERQKIIDEKKQSLKEMSALKEKNEQVKLQNENLKEIIREEKKALEKLKELKETLQSNISLMETEKAEMTCCLADVEGDLELYMKALSLVIEQYTKGKSQNLLKFFKFLQHPKLRQLLRPLVKH